MKLTRIDHVAVAVEDIDRALGFFRDVLGLEVVHTDLEPGQGVVVAFMPIGNSELELIEPVDADSGVARFLAKRGGGMHHLCLEVDDLDEAVARLKQYDVRLIDETPYVGTGGRRIIFIHPSSAAGVLVELYEQLPDDRRNRRLESLEQLRRQVIRSGRVAAAGTMGFFTGLRRGRNGRSAESDRGSS